MVVHATGLVNEGYAVVTYGVPLVGQLVSCNSPHHPQSLSRMNSLVGGSSRPRVIGCVFCPVEGVRFGRTRVTLGHCQSVTVTVTTVPLHCSLASCILHLCALCLVYCTHCWVRKQVNESVWRELEAGSIVLRTVDPGRLRGGTVVAATSQFVREIDIHHCLWMEAWRQSCHLPVMALRSVYSGYSN
jgi:hypothetical protein